MSDPDAVTRGRVDAQTLASYYSRFRVRQRVLLTGHSHQAWPDVGFEGQQQAWRDAAELVDDKWDRAFAKADRVREGFRSILGDPDGRYALGANTHELVVRFLSALPLRQRPRIVTTPFEYHSLRRQLDRLTEEGIDVVKRPPEDIAQAVDDRTSVVCLSAVLYQSARIVDGLDDIAAACRRHGAHLLVDAYHALNAIPFTVHGLEDAFIVGGGYKYCQLGEGNCFLRYPVDCTLRPVVTGWFSEFSLLDTVQRDGVPYGNDRFAGSTYDPTSHYRAACVFDFFSAQDLTPTRLRATNQHQVARMVARLEGADLNPALVRGPDLPLERVAGFLALTCADAAGICAALRTRGVHADVRGTVLRLGPAPYVSDAQLDQAIDALVEVVS